jgi:hypothetical protein
MVKNLENIIDTCLTIEERNTLEKANEILRELQSQLGDKMNMMAVESGEIISTNEFARARGILGGLAEYRTWQLSLNLKG